MPFTFICDMMNVQIYLNDIIFIRIRLKFNHQLNNFLFRQQAPKSKAYSTYIYSARNKLEFLYIE